MEKEITGVYISGHPLDQAADLLRQGFTTAAEAKDPERTLPRAINSIPVRIIVFYVLALIAIMTVTPWRDVVPSKSPFV